MRTSPAIWIGICLGWIATAGCSQQTSTASSAVAAPLPSVSDTPEAAASSEDRNEYPISFTAAAAKEIKQIAAAQRISFDTPVRVGIAGGGCNGFQYKFGFDDNTDASKDEVLSSRGIRIVILKRDLLFLKGTTMDFYDGLEKRGFVFNNPLVDKPCNESAKEDASPAGN